MSKRTLYPTATCQHEALLKKVLRQSVGSLAFIVLTTCSFDTVAWSPPVSPGSQTNANAVARTCSIHKAPRLLHSNGPVSGDERSTKSDPFLLQIHEVIEPMIQFFSDMVDTSSESTFRFYSTCRPSSTSSITSTTECLDHEPHVSIRDLAAAWDATKVLQWYQQDSHHQDRSTRERSEHQKKILDKAVVDTICAYKTTITSSTTPGQQDSYCLDLPRATIAHSAMMLLATSGAIRLHHETATTMWHQVPMDGLTRGILSVQHQTGPNDGAFQIVFGESPITNSNVESAHARENVLKDVEFAPGEAMLALMEVYELSTTHSHMIQPTTRNLILPAMERAFHFYFQLYHDRESFGVGTNYNIWQIQAFARYLPFAEPQTAPLVETYIYKMCQDIIQSRSWKELNRGKSFFPNLKTIEIACCLDALAASCSSNQSWRRQVETAVDFLQWSQDRVPAEAPVGRGGLGHGGYHVIDQRLDVTGHAVSALIQLSYRIRDPPTAKEW